MAKNIGNDLGVVKGSTIKTVATDDDSSVADIGSIAVDDAAIDPALIAAPPSQGDATSLEDYLRFFAPLPVHRPPSATPAAVTDTSASGAALAGAEPGSAVGFDDPVSPLTESAASASISDHILPTTDTGAAAPASAGGSPAIAGSAPSPAAAATAQPKFISLGPAPSTGPEGIVQSGDLVKAGGNWGTVAGAVQAIVTKPGDANTIWIGTPNGGVWVTHDGGATWTPLTDKQASLSIASLSLDPTDTSGNTLIAGIGATSSGFVDAGYRSGLLDGLLYSTDGGDTWTSLGSSTLNGQTIIGVAARGSVLLAASFDRLSPGDGVGRLYRSTNGGATFDAPISGLPTAPVTSLVGDPTTPNTLYAAITSPTNKAATAVYVSTGSGTNVGASWTKIFDSTNSGGKINATTQTVAQIAVNASLHEIAIGLIDVSTFQLVGIYLSKDDGASWGTGSLPLPPSLNPGNYFTYPFAVTLDPTTSGIVYVAGAAPSGAVRRRLSTGSRLPERPPSPMTSPTRSRPRRTLRAAQPSMPMRAR